MRVPRLIILALVPFLEVPADAQPASADFLIVERPGRLRIYDRFEQHLSADRFTLPRFTAFQVVAEHTTLGDGITPVMSVRLDGGAHYLVRDPETGKLVGERDLGAVTRVRAARPHWDSLDVVAPAGVAFTPASGGRQRHLPAGTALVRAFTSEGRAFVRTRDASPEYGWIAGGPEADGRLWRKARNVAAGGTRGPAAPPEFINRVRERVARTNEIIAEIYATVESTTGGKLQTPAWRVETEGATIRCLLFPLPPDSARASSVLLGKHIEALTLGTRFRVTAAPGRIEVRP